MLTQHSHIFKIKIDGLCSLGSFLYLVSALKLYLVAFYSSEKPLHSIMAFYKWLTNSRSLRGEI